MYKHHEESLQIMVSHYKKRSEVIALIFGGSVAKGQERIDSDLMQWRLYRRSVSGRWMRGIRQLR